MTIIDIIKENYPEVDASFFVGTNPKILVQDDSDGLGPYIAKWEYDKPIPDGLTLGKPIAQ